MIGLKPCPLCGCHAIMTSFSFLATMQPGDPKRRETTYAVRCASCHFGIGNRVGYLTVKTAAKAWNSPRDRERLVKIEVLEALDKKLDSMGFSAMYNFSGVISDMIAELKEEGE